MLARYFYDVTNSVETAVLRFLAVQPPRHFEIAMAGVKYGHYSLSIELRK
jgi:hypothetical protein